MIRNPDALRYHAGERPGKLEVKASKPCLSPRELRLAYLPGATFPASAIAQDPAASYLYTCRGNLVGVVTNGTAVPGLGAVGAGAAKPIQEGIAVLFKTLADIDVFDLELDAASVDELVGAVRMLEPTFGAINLKDLRSPDGLAAYDRLVETMHIPVFHEGLYGTAVVATAALLNALELAGKRLEQARVVICGAGTVGLGCARLLRADGLPAENLLLYDVRGHVHPGRDDLSVYQREFARTGPPGLAGGLEGADVFLGASVAGTVDQAMIRSMARFPIVFAMAMPDPEIEYQAARAVRRDVIVGTSRAQDPNAITDLLSFPYIFRGALDVRARAINEEMKLAATYALADLAKEDVPEAVADAYGKQSFSFGPEYLIPKPFDYRVLLWVAPAVARAAMESGVARQTVDLEQYRNALESRLGRRREVMRDIILKAKQEPKRIVYPEGEHERVLRAAAQIVEEGIAHPVLIGHPERIRACAAAHGVELTGIETIPPQDYDLRVERYATKLFEKRQRKGLTMSEARARMRQPVYFGCMMVEEDDADGLVAGENTNYPETIRPALEVIGTAPDSRHVAGLYMMVLQHDIMFFADTTVNIEPDAETLAEIALMSAAFVTRLGIRPALAMLSFSNFGSTRVPQAERVKHAVEIVKSRAPNLTVEGEMQVDVAVLPELLAAQFPFSRLKERANVLIFPDLNAANIAYKLLWRLGGAEAIGPILLGMDRPIHVLQRDASAADIVNLSALAVVDAQRRAPRPST